MSVCCFNVFVANGACVQIEYAVLHIGVYASQFISSLNTMPVNSPSQKLPSHIYPPSDSDRIFWETKQLVIAWKLLLDSVMFNNNVSYLSESWLSLVVSFRIHHASFFRPKCLTLQGHVIALELNWRSSAACFREDPPGPRSRCEGTQGTAET